MLCIGKWSENIGGINNYLQQRIIFMLFLKKKLKQRIKILIIVEFLI